MRAALRVALVVLPFLAVFLVILWLAGGEGRRWRERVEAYVPGAVVGVDEDDLLVIAGDAARAREAAEKVRDFHRALAKRYTDLLGEPRFDRMVVVVFPDVESVEAYAGDSGRVDRGAAGNLEGFTDPAHGAVFVPADAIGTLRHETVHWFMETARDATVPSYSPWLSEGLAQLFETLDPTAVPPEPPRVEDLVLPRGLDVDRLIDIEDYGQFLLEGGRNYAEALALTGFLFETRPRELREYVEVERRSADGRPFAFRQIFRPDEEPFRRDLAKFIAGLR